MKGLILSIIVISGLSVLASNAFAESLFYGSSSFERLHSMTPGMSSGFEIKIQYTAGPYQIGKLSPVFDVSPKDAASYVQIKANPLDGLSRNDVGRIQGTMSVDSQIPHDKIFVTVSFDGLDSYGNTYRSAWADSATVDVNRAAPSENMTYSQFLDFCSIHDPPLWESMSIGERQLSNLCGLPNIGERQWAWLNGTALDWESFAKNASESYAYKIPEFTSGGMKGTLRVDSFVSDRDSFPPPMVAMISFDYEKLSQVIHYDAKFTICIDGKLIPQDGFIECSDEYVQYDFTKEEPFSVPKLAKKIPLPEHTRQQMSDWCQNSPKWASVDKQFWDVVPVRLVSNTDEFQSLQGIKDSFVISSNVEHYTCPPTVWASGTFASEDGKNHRFALEYDAGFFRYAIDEIRCKGGLTVVIKSADGSFACVKPETKQKLIERGWAIPSASYVLVSGKAAQMICSVLDWNCPADQTFRGTKTGDVINVQQQLDGKKYHFEFFPGEFCYHWEGAGVSLCRTDYPTVTISSLHDPRPDALILEIGVNNTVYWKNESDVPVTLASEDGRWSTGVILPNDGKTITFNQTAFYEYRGIPHAAINGRIAIISDETGSLPISERLQIAREIIKVDMGNPITGIGVGNADNVLAITIHEDELKNNQDAESYYEKRYSEMIPFDIPIRISFGHASPD